MSSQPTVVAAGVPPRIAAFLRVATPQAWVERALADLEALLLDHAACEQKAAATALSLMHRYAPFERLVERMSRLAREELRHFEQVRAQMRRAGIQFRTISASRYAAALRACVRHTEPARLLDTLLVGALIEARSCERFALLAPRLPEPLDRFYAGLLASEARHFEDYLVLAREAAIAGSIGEAEVEARLGELLAVEATLVTAPDPQFRFHSGLPESSTAS
jgi:tRNA-(ms[2]io[6]A)-hydroxylase